MSWRLPQLPSGAVFDMSKGRCVACAKDSDDLDARRTCAACVRELDEFDRRQDVLTVSSNDFGPVSA